MIYRFADCELDIVRFELRRDGLAQKIEPQVFEVLRYLVERPGQFVGKEELHRAVWQGRVVSDAAMSSRIKAARRAIGDTGEAQRVIRTVHGRGFSFVAPVTAAEQMSVAGPSGAADAAPSEVLLSADLHLNELLNGDGPAGEAERDLRARRAALRAEIEGAGGRLLEAAGGGVFARFGSALAALQCAASVQQARRTAARGEAVEASRRARIGLCELRDDFPRAIAIAARLQCCAAPGEICITGGVGDAARRGIEFSRRALAGGQATELDELDACVVEPGGPATDPRPGAIPQLQCGYPVPPREPSIVILPFEALGSDPRAAELAEGLRIDIQNGLVKIARILLIAVASANAFRGRSPDEAARGLGVRHVLHGVVQTEGGQARVFVELIDTPSGRAVWSEQFRLALTDAFTIQDEVTRKVIAALDVKLYSGEQARNWHESLNDPDAVELFYRGVHLFFRMERDPMTQARRAFEAVAEIRPRSSIGATWTALCHWMDYLRNWSAARAESKAHAKRWAETASRLEDADGQAHTVLAHVRLLDREFDAALEAGRRTLEIRPGCANANGFFGNVLHYCGEQSDAIRHLRKSIRLQPVYPPFFASVLGTAYLASGQAEAALAVAKEALRLNANDLQSRLVLVAGSQMAGNRGLAGLFAREILRLDAGFSVAAYCAGQPYRHCETVERMAEPWRAAELPA